MSKKQAKSAAFRSGWGRVWSSTGWLFMLGCSSPVTPPVEVVATKIEGLAFFEGPLAGREVEVYDFDRGKLGERLTTTVANESGQWVADVGPLSGAFLVTVPEHSELGGEVLSAIVEDVQVGMTRSQVALTPVTHLARVYAEVLLGRGQELGSAIPRARQLIDGFFGGVAHDQTKPIDPLEALPVSAGEELVAGVLDVAFAEHARRRQTAGAKGDASATAFVRSLSQDLAADGLFDGLGSNGTALDFGGRALSSNTLRVDYGESVLGFVGSPRNASGADAQDFVGIVELMRENRTELFPAVEPPPLDKIVPTIDSVQILDQSGAPTRHPKIVGGEIFIEVVVSDAGGVEQIELLGIGLPAVSDAMPEAERARWAIDTRSLSDGWVDWEIRATDHAGNVVTTPLRLRLDNTRPTLQIQGPDRADNALATVQGTFSDSSTVSVSFSVDGVAAGRVDEPTTTFTTQVPVSCHGPVTISAVAEDVAGNASEVSSFNTECQPGAVTVVLDASTFFQEGDLSVARVGSSQLAYTEPARPREVSLSEQTLWPLRVEKYFTRLDAGAPNLPVLRLRAENAQRLEYRYLVGVTERRGWTIVPMNERGQGAVALSYQSLGPDLAAWPVGAEHIVEVRATGDLGQEVTRAFRFNMAVLMPPLWVSTCRPIAGSMPWADIRSVFEAARDTDAFEADVAYLLDLPSGSAAPLPSVEIFGSASGSTWISAIDEVKWASPWAEGTTNLCRPSNFPIDITGSTPAPSTETYVQTRAWLHQPAQCEVGSLPDARPTPVPSAYPVSDVNPVGYEIRFDDPAAQPLVSIGEGWFRLPVALAVRGVLRAQSPRIKVGGRELMWGAGLPALPSGYTSQASLSGRYWLPQATWTTGQDFSWINEWLNQARIRSFETRASIASIHLEASGFELTAVNRRNLWMRIPTARDASCASAFGREVGP